MRALFTVHAGEYLVGSEIEGRLPGSEVWMPARDTGVDLLVTHAPKRKMVSLQVKFSRDFLVSDLTDSRFQEGLLACGWWTLNQKKIQESRADLWVLVLQAFDPKQTQYVLIPPRDLRQRLLKIHGRKNRLHTYVWVTRKKRCWETRGLRKKERILIANHAYANRDRDFTVYLNTWSDLKRRLSL